MRSGHIQKRKAAGGGPASKENTKHIVGSLHKGTWLIFIHISENNLVIFSFRVARKSTVNWNFKQQMKKAVFLLRNFSFCTKSHNHVCLWWLNTFPERAISYFGGDVLLLLFHANKGAQTASTSIMVFLLKQIRCITFSRVPQIVNGWSRDFHLRWKSHCTTPAYCPAPPYHCTWHCSSSSGKSPGNQQKIFPRLNKIKSFELLL